MSIVGKNLGAFRAGIADHDARNPSHSANGIGLAYFDMERCGFEEGETLWGSITIHADNGCTGNFRILCDGDHDGAHEHEEVEQPVDARGRELVSV